MRRRTIGPAGPQVSELSYGSMRLPDWSIEKASDWLCELHDSGIDTHHSSHEYDAHTRYLDALARARSTGREFGHIVKLSSPSFDSSDFDAGALEALVEQELTALGSESLVNVQWLVRTPDAGDSRAQISVLENQTAEILGLFQRLIDEGKVRSYSAFPYSTDFAQAVVRLLPQCSLAAYLNPVETQYSHLLAKVPSFLAIRPLGGGDKGLDPAQAVRFSLLHPNVSTAIVSVNQPKHLEDLLDATADLEPSATGFAKELSQLS